mgnify:CR=1 FL=1
MRPRPFAEVTWLIMLIQDFLIQRQVPEWRGVSQQVKLEVLEAARQSTYVDGRENARIVQVCLASAIVLFLLLSVLPYYLFESSLPAGVGAALTAVLTLVIASVFRTTRIIEPVRFHLQRKLSGGDRR